MVMGREDAAEAGAWSAIHALRLCSRCLLLRTVVEWVEYHLLIGVELFLLFSNECDDEEDALVDGLLQPYTAAGLVVVDKRFRCATKFQTSAYRAGLQWFRDHHPMEW